MSSILDNSVDVLARIIRVVLAIGILAMIALNFANAISRYVFASPMLGADELQRLLLVWAVFLGAVVAEQRGAHIRMDVLFMALPLVWGRIIRATETLIAVALFVFMTYVSGQYFLRMVALDDVSDATGLPTSVMHLAAAVGFGLMTVVAVVRLVQLAAGRYQITRSPALT
jgi:TRAP-type transport system small permease protein